MFFGLFGGHKCKICGKETKEVLEQFEPNPGSFSDGLFIPYAKEGMYVSNC